MLVTYNKVNNTYRCRDGVHWFPARPTMQEAINGALSVLIYYSEVDKFAKNNIK